MSSPKRRLWNSAILSGILISTSASSSENRVGEIQSEIFWADDIRLTQTIASYKESTADWSWKLGLAGGTSEVDYQPASFDRLSTPETLNFSRLSAQFELQRKLSDQFTVSLSPSGYSGFTSYRSAWVAEYYRQADEEVPGYETPQPHGGSVSTSLRWAYRPGTGFITAEVTYAQDIIAPSYDDVLDPELGRIGVDPFASNLSTWAGRLLFENVVNRRLRTQLELRVASQSERQPRLGVIGSMRFAPAESWVIQGEAGYTRESLEPPDDAPEDFVLAQSHIQAWWLSSSIEKRITDSWYVHIGGRYYQDEGEIESSISFSSAAPALDATQLWIGLRWQHENHTVRLSGGPYFTDYDRVPLTIRAFENLYRDRTFALVQATYRFEF